MAYPMSEAKLEPLRVDFDRRVKLEFHGSDISSDGGLLPYVTEASPPFSHIQVTGIFLPLKKNAGAP